MKTKALEALVLRISKNGNNSIRELTIGRIFNIQYYIFNLSIFEKGIMHVRSLLKYTGNDLAKYFEYIEKGISP